MSPIRSNLEWYVDQFKDYIPPGWKEPIGAFGGVQVFEMEEGFIYPLSYQRIGGLVSLTTWGKSDNHMMAWNPMTVFVNIQKTIVWFIMQVWYDSLPTWNKGPQNFRVGYMLDTVKHNLFKDAIFGEVTLDTDFKFAWDIYQAAVNANGDQEAVYQQISKDYGEPDHIQLLLGKGLIPVKLASKDGYITIS